jgi:hypothetical protein
MKIHFFTIVLNGMPFIKRHIETFLKLKLDWHWHIVEGVAALENCTAWSIANGGRIADFFHIDGLSNDGTSQYLDSIKEKYPKNISIYRKNGGFWNGKVEMVNAPLPFIHQESLLFQIDVDEFWTTSQLELVHSLFISNPKKFAAFYWCHYFVGPKLLVSTRNGYANNPSFEWERTWRFLPHFRWASHEPPVLVEKTYSGEVRPIRNRGLFTHQETEKEGLIFYHYAYVFESQLRFKEIYYGYQNAVINWKRLQQNSDFPCRLSNFFNWVTDDTMIDKSENMGIESINNFV